MSGSQKASLAFACTESVLTKELREISIQDAVILLSETRVVPTQAPLSDFFWQRKTEGNSSVLFNAHRFEKDFEAQFSTIRLKVLMSFFIKMLHGF